jgi:hypothetical protein
VKNIIIITITFITLCYLLSCARVLAVSCVSYASLLLRSSYVVDRQVDRKIDVLLHTTAAICFCLLLSRVDEWTTVYTRLGLVRYTPIAGLVWCKQNRHLYQLGCIHCSVFLFGMVSFCLFWGEKHMRTSCCWRSAQRGRLSFFLDTGFGGHGKETIQIRT